MNEKDNKKIWFRVLFALAVFLYIAAVVVVVYVFGNKDLEKPLTIAAPAVLFVFSILCNVVEKPKNK